MRRPDKPGTFRVVYRNGGTYMLSGVRANGSRVKVKGLSKDEAESMGARIFRDHSAINPDGLARAVNELPPLDDYGLPILKPSPAVIASTAPPNQAQPDGLLNKPPVDPEKKEKARKQAQSLMELAGIGWTAGSVWAGRKITERAGCEPVSPSKEHVKQLSTATQETLTDLFGDTEVKPWQMMILLTLAIPVSMLIQSPKKSPAKLAAEQAEKEVLRQETPLRSV